jgi:ParB family transcriptional regulator, chromosome partitioning protein
MQIEQRLVTDLVPYINNARTHSDAQVAQIAASIKEFGWTSPILVDGENGVMAGHGRLLAARKLGYAEVPVIELAHLSEAQRRAYILADNKLALNAGWDDELLRIELDALQELGADIDLTGFDLDEIEALSIDCEPLDEMPVLRDGDREPYQQMAFMLHDEQAEQVDRAIAVAKKMGPFTDDLNQNSNGNALARICEIFLTTQGEDL